MTSQAEARQRILAHYEQDGLLGRIDAGLTEAVVEEIAPLAFLVVKIDGPEPRPWEQVLMQHTRCGAERFADPDFQRALKEHTGVDVSSSAIAEHEQSLREDVERLRSAPNVPGYIVVSGISTTCSTAIFAKSSPRPLLRRLDHEASNFA